MTRQEHIARHELLQQMFDELVADFLLCNRGATLSGTTVMALMGWSYLQTIAPENEAHGGRLVLQENVSDAAN